MGRNKDEEIVFQKFHNSKKPVQEITQAFLFYFELKIILVESSILVPVEFYRGHRVYRG